MKFTIEGFSQPILFSLGLDVVDALVLRWFVDFFASGEMKMVPDDTGQQFAWIKYSSAIEELPCTGIKTADGMARRFKKLADCGVLEHFHYKVGGSYSTYRMGPRFRSLITSTPTDQKSEGYGPKVGAPTDQKSEQTTLLLENSSTKNKESIADLALSYLNEKTCSKFRSHKGTGLTTMISQGTTLDTIKAVIDLKVKEWTGTDMAQYLTPSTLFRVSNFEKYENQLRLGPSKAKPRTNRIQMGFETFDPRREMPDEIPM